MSDEAISRFAQTLEDVRVVRDSGNEDVFCLSGIVSALATWEVELKASIIIQRQARHRLQQGAPLTFAAAVVASGALATPSPKWLSLAASCSVAGNKSIAAVYCFYSSILAQCKEI